MSYLPYSAWRDEQLTRHTMTVDGSDVSYWCSQARPHHQTLLFVHGISGDHNGLVPLAREFSDTYNIVLIELPGHGESQRQKLHNAHDLQAWFELAHEELTNHTVKIDWIIAHSFGCSAVVKTAKAKVILLCPVTTPSGLYRQYARITKQLAPFWALFYSWRIFVWLRGTTLQKVRTRQASRRIRWAGFQSRASYAQIIYQARLIDIILDTAAYQHVTENVALVICGLEDTTAAQRDSAELEPIFPHSRIEFLRGGHLLPIETPERVAEQIKQIL